MSSSTSAPASGHGKVVRAQEYWAGKLSGGLGFANLNADRERAARHDADASTTTGLVEFAFPAEVNRQLERVTGGTPFLLYTALMTALKVCLFKYTGSRIVTVGSPARLRQEPSATAALALAIRDELNEAMTFRELLMRVRETLLEAYAGQSYAYERVVRDLGLEHIEDRCPLFDVALVLEAIHEPLPDLRNDVTIRFAGGDDGFAGRVEYAARLFDQATIERFAGHYGQTLRSGLLRPETMLADIELLTASERQQMLVEWNETAAVYPQDESFYELFEQQAQRTPDALALVFGHERISYQELNARANRLAHHLRSLGVGAEVLVGLCLERSVEMVVGLLAILKAGGAYVPLDSSYPRERLSFMLEDAGVRFLLTQSHLAGSLRLAAAHVILLDTDAAAIARQSDADPVCVTTQDNAAYVIYTSGSTGRPKGVILQHGGLRNLVAAQSQTFRLSREARVLQFASLSFDASVAEVTLALGAGATLCLAPQETLMPGADFINFLREQHINNVTLPPSALLALPLEELPELETIIVAGEACPAEVVARWAAGRRFFNAYGPTEATVWATGAECSPSDERITIGRPVANKVVYLLDSNLRPVPVGVAAQLLIGGAGFARGYLSRPALTAEKFVPHPFSTEPGARLYRTGDMARYLPDGRIEFLGRADQQVKVRGYRIELGEVEAALGRMPGVRQCVVTATAEETGGRRLVAYVVADGGAGEAPEAGELRRRLREQLPDYMIPAAFVALAEMPLTLNGKIDRNALPPLEAVRRASGESSEAAHSPVEEVLAGICAEVLGLERVGVDENFFELGGHSLLATSVFSRLREAFRVDLPIKTLFESPTVAQLARNVEAAMRTGSGVEDLPLRPVARGAQLPLSFAQQRMWFLHQLDPSNPLYNIPIALRLAGDLDPDVLGRALDEIARRHESLRTTFEVSDGVPAQVISRGQRLNLTARDLSVLPEDEREGETARLAAEEARRPFDLERGPLLRVTLLRRSAQEHVLLFTMHHIISDGWSLGVLIREVAALYDAYLNGLPSPLAELPLQYVDYAYWQREWLRGEMLESQLAYWRAQLDGAHTTLEIPSSRPRPAVRGHRGSFVHIQLAQSLATELKTLGRREGATLFMVLLAAFQTLLHRYTGQDKIVVGSPVANRNRREIEGLIGCFLNVLALHTDTSGNPSFRELLVRVRQVALGAYAHQDVPFEKLVGELQLERELSHAPLFQAVFVLQNMPMGRLELTGLAIERLDVQRGTTQSDLYFSITETGQGLTGTLKYNSDLYDARLIERMLRDYEIILNEVSARPELRLLDIPLRSEGSTDFELSAAATARDTYVKDQFAF
jgi:amino acid adenylation domain-containing protein